MATLSLLDRSRVFLSELTTAITLDVPFQMLEKLEEGLDDNSTCTKDVIKKLQLQLPSSNNYLLVTDVDHYGAGNQCFNQ